MTRPTATPPEPKPALMPTLRFPEFQKESGWKETVLSIVLTEHEEKNDGKSEVHSVSVHKGVINQVEHLGRSFAAADRSNYNLAKPHDIIYTKSPTGDFPFGIVKQNRLPYNVIVSPLYGVFSPVNRHLGYILDAYFESPIRTNNYLAPITQKGAKNTIQISNDTFLSKGLYLPPSEAEHKKIAECLSTLDELIGAESQKLDALKAHKKGLMQQLFPREGETLPRLRFPEFHSAPEWNVPTIQKLIDENHIIGHLDGNHGELYPRAEEFSNSGIPYITANDFADGFVSFDRCRFLPEERALQFRKGVAKDGDVLFAHNATVGPVAKLSTDLKFVILSTTATYFRCDPKFLSADFLKAALTSPAFVSQYSRVMAQSTRNQVPITAQRKFFLQIPQPPEQHRIATCLSPLDDLIAAQSDRLSALQTHKQGLLQQLFPAPADASA
jgi:type I restriction enzyme S subunit